MLPRGLLYFLGESICFSPLTLGVVGFGLLFLLLGHERILGDVVYVQSLSLRSSCSWNMFILGGFGAYFSPLDSKLFSALDISIFDRFTTVLGLVWFSAVVGYILGLGCLDFLGVRFL